MDPAAQHILVVDDDRDIRTLLAEQLADAGYRVSAAADGVVVGSALVNIIRDGLSKPEGIAPALAGRVADLRAGTPRG